MFVKKMSLINKTKGQELACHTYSHYYCNEEGQTIQQFDEDLKSAQIISKKNFNVELKSLVFPRNQINKDYLDIVINNGFKVVRSNPNVWFWQKSCMQENRNKPSKARACFIFKFGMG